MSTTTYQPVVSEWPEHLIRYKNEIIHLNEQQLIRHITDLLSVSVENLTRLAVAIRRAEEIGIDLTDLRNKLEPTLGVFGDLRRIAYGQLLPEVVCRFRGRRKLLKAASNLPLPAQLELVTNETVKVAEFGQGGEVTHRNVPISNLCDHEIDVVLAPDHIRDVNEQAVLLRRKKREREEAPTLPPPLPTYRVQHRPKGIKVGHGPGEIFISLAELETIVKQLTSR